MDTAFLIPGDSDLTYTLSNRLRLIASIMRAIMINCLRSDFTVKFELYRKHQYSAGFGGFIYNEPFNDVLLVFSLFLKHLALSLI